MDEYTPKYLPGFEPDDIKPLVDSFLDVINRVFPDKVVVRNEWNHQWDNAANMLCKKLGYSNGKDFLEAYGFSVVDDTHPFKSKEIGSSSGASIKHCLSCGSLIGIESTTCSRCGGKEFESYEEYILNGKRAVVVNSNSKKIISNPSKNNERKQKQGKKKLIIVAVVLLALFFALPRCVDCGKICFTNRIPGTLSFYCDDCYAIFKRRPLNISGGSGNSTNTSTANSSNTFTEIDSKDDNWGYAVAAAQNLVKEKLKSPSTAKFPWNGYSVKKRGNDYIVEGYVDAQNSLGATIRTNWKATFTLGDTSGTQYKISNYDVTLYE